VEASEAAEAPFGDPLALQIGKDDLAGVADAHPFDFALPVDEDAHLAPDLPGNLGELPREVLGDERARWKPPCVELLEPVPLAGLEADDVAFETVNG
jgi:hypothetical protein